MNENVFHGNGTKQKCQDRLSNLRKSWKGMQGKVSFTDSRFSDSVAVRFVISNGEIEYRLENYGDPSIHLKI